MDKKHKIKKLYLISAIVRRAYKKHKNNTDVDGFPECEKEIIKLFKPTSGYDLTDEKGSRQISLKQAYKEWQEQEKNTKCWFCELYEKINFIIKR